MSEHGHIEAGRGGAADRLDLGPRAWPLFVGSAIVGMVGLLLAAAVDVAGHDVGLKRFLFAYLTSYAFFLSIALGALFFVMLQHLTRAGWSVSVRRVGEAFGATLPLLAALSAPIVVSVVIQNGDLYPWARRLSDTDAHAVDHGAAPKDTTPTAVHPAPETRPATGPAAAVLAPASGEGAHHKGLDALTLKKRAWLNPAFFLARLVVYFGVWAGLGVWYWKMSTRQDESGEVALTRRMEAFSAPGLLLLGVTLTLATVDLIMSLDPHWYSTMIGVYYFAGSAVGFFAAIILVLHVLQRMGFVVRSVSTEHYHDLGKFLFAFTFFWGYIAFSQYMLLWYANLPETTGWMIRHGASTAPEYAGHPWRLVVIALLLGHLLIPFAGLMSRHVKRNRTLLAFWAGWMLVFHYLDMYWLVMPEYGGHGPQTGAGHGLPFGIIEIGCFLGVGGLFFAAFVRFLARHHLRPIKDPRLGEALAFENV